LCVTNVCEDESCCFEGDFVEYHFKNYPAHIHIAVKFQMDTVHSPTDAHILELLLKFTLK